MSNSETFGANQGEAEPAQQIEQLKDKIRGINALASEGAMGTKEAGEEIEKFKQQISELEGSSQEPETEEDKNPSTEDTSKAEVVEQAQKIEEDETWIDEVNALTKNNQIGTEKIDYEVSKQEKETDNLEGSDTESAETFDKSEYLKRKKDFMQTKAEYFDALTEKHSRKGIGKWVGLGRKEMNESVKEKYDQFMQANNEYYRYAEESGFLKQYPSLNTAVANRHVLRPAEERMEVQSMHLPESVRSLKNWVLEKAKKGSRTAESANPRKAKFAKYLGASVLTAGVTAGIVLGPLSAGAVVGGLAANRLANLYVKYEELGRRNLTESTSSSIGQKNLNLEELEKQYFNSLRGVKTAKKVRFGATIGGAVAGGTWGEDMVAQSDWFGGGSETGQSAPAETSEAGPDEEYRPPEISDRPEDFEPITNGGEVTPEADTSNQMSNENPEISTENETAASEAMESRSENIFVPERGDTMSEALLETLRAKLDAGTIELPGMDGNNLSGHIYESIPEFTGADLNPEEWRLDPKDWRELGVESGNPHQIQPGEEIDMDGLIEKVWGGEGAESASVENNTTPAAEAQPESVGGESAEVATNEATTDVAGSEATTAGEGQSGIEASGAEATPQVPEKIANLLDTVDKEEFPPNFDNYVVESVTDNGNKVTWQDPEHTYLKFEAEFKSGWWPFGEDRLVVDGYNTRDLAQEWSDLAEQGSSTEGATEATQAGAEQAAEAPELKLTEEYRDVTTTYEGDMGARRLQEDLAQITIDAYRDGMSIPTDVADKLGDSLQSDAQVMKVMKAYVTETIPELSNSLFENKPNALSPQEWRELGISSGNPKEIAGGETIQLGELLRILQEKSAADRGFNY